MSCRCLHSDRPLLDRGPPRLPAMLFPSWSCIWLSQPRHRDRARKLEVWTTCGPASASGLHPRINLPSFVLLSQPLSLAPLPHPGTHTKYTLVGAFRQTREPDEGAKLSEPRHGTGTLLVRRAVGGACVRQGWGRGLILNCQSDQSQRRLPRASEHMRFQYRGRTALPSSDWLQVEMFAFYSSAEREN